MAIVPAYLNTSIAVVMQGMLEISASVSKHDFLHFRSFSPVKCSKGCISAFNTIQQFRFRDFQDKILDSDNLYKFLFKVGVC